MSGHTAGPWFALDSCTTTGLEVRGGGHHYPIAKMCSYWSGPGPREDEAKANYELVAAAPDLLEALDMLITAVEFEAYPIADGVDVHRRVNILLDCALKARAVANKAKGEK